MNKSAPIYNIRLIRVPPSVTTLLIWEINIKDPSKQLGFYHGDTKGTERHGGC